MWDGSSGETHPGYWLVDVTGAEVHGCEIVPVCQKLFSTKAKDFIGENAEGLAGVDRVRAYTGGRGIWTVDRGGDRKKLLKPLLDRHERFVIRSTGKRFVTGRDHLQRSVAELGCKCRLRHRARVIKIQDGQEKTYDQRYGVEPIRLIGRDEPLDLVVVAGFGEEPMLLLIEAGSRQNSLDSIGQGVEAEGWKYRRNAVNALELSGTVVTIDAMGCQRAIAEKIVAKKVDYILAVKENQGHLLDEIKDSFQMLAADAFAEERPAAFSSKSATTSPAWRRSICRSAECPHARATFARSRILFQRACSQSLLSKTTGAHPGLH